MNWKFWIRGQKAGLPDIRTDIKLPRPKDLPDRVGRYLVTRLKEDPDWVWSLKAALRPRAGEKDVFDIRIFNPEEAADKGLAINSYDSLDSHPEIILFAGWYRKNSDDQKIERILQKVA